jgi:hypothetical protein
MQLSWWDVLMSWKPILFDLGILLLADGSKEIIWNANISTHKNHVYLSTIYK